MKRVLRATLKWGLVAFLCFVVVLVLFYWEEDWRGARDWANCQKELAAKGEILDLRTLCPPGNPKDDLSKVPIFADLYQKSQPVYGAAAIDRIDVRSGVRDKSQPLLSDYMHGKPADLHAWATFLSSPSPASSLGMFPSEVLGALRKMDTEMSAVAKATENPNAYFPLNYADPFETRLHGPTQLLQVAKVLSLEGAAHLANSSTQMAEQDYQFSCNLERTLSHDGTLINFLLIIAIRAMDDSILWEGIHQHGWDEAQLHEIESRLKDLDILDLAPQILRVERAHFLAGVMALQNIDWRKKRNIGLFFALRPPGWWDQDYQKSTLEMQTRIEAFDLGQGRLSLPKEKTLCGFSRWWEFIYTPTAAEAAYTSKFFLMVAEAETHNRLTRIACELEEYYLVHENYPESLSQLADLPPHLNEEVLTGRPMHYGRKGNSYFLYSTGWDGKDRGGIPKGPLTGDNYDWIWPGP